MNDVQVYIRPETTEPLVIGNQVFKSVYDWVLTEKDLEKARLELGETEENKIVHLRKFKEKLSQDANLKYFQDDLYLLRFLRARKYDLLKAHQNIKTLYNMRRREPAFFTIPPELKFLRDINWITCLPYTDEEGRLIFYSDTKKWNVNEQALEDVGRIGVIVSDMFSMNPKCQINGTIGIYDVGGITLKHLPGIAQNGWIWTALSLVQAAYPWRIQKLIFLNTHRLARYVYSIVKPFIKAKLTERIFLLGSDMNELHQHVNPALLPKALNGTLKEEECNRCLQYIIDNVSYLRYERSFIT